MKLLPIFFFVSVLFIAEAGAVLVYNGTAANQSAPTDDPGWDAVGRIFIGTPDSDAATAIFLGNVGGYARFLTANHVNLTNATVNIGGGNYTNNGTGSFGNVLKISGADLKVFSLNATLSGITAVSLASSVPSAGSDVTMIGNGRTGAYVTWNTTGNGTWTSPGTDADGYTWATPNVKQWGSNEVLQINHDGGALGMCLATAFDDTDGVGQGSRGDSGGGIFYKNGGDWELAGVMVDVGRVQDGTLYGSDFAGQPGSTSVASITGQPDNKSTTFSVQIANYRSEILAAIPEPCAAPLLIAGVGLLAARRRVVSKKS